MKSRIIHISISFLLILSVLIIGKGVGVVHCLATDKVEIIPNPKCNGHKCHDTEPAKDCMEIGFLEMPAAETAHILTVNPGFQKELPLAVILHDYHRPSPTFFIDSDFTGNPPPLLSRIIIETSVLII